MVQIFLLKVTNYDQNISAGYIVIAYKINQ